MKARVNRVTIQIVQDDALALEVAALVLPTDTNLTLAPRVASRVGAEVLRELAQIGYCAVGSAVMTGAGELTVDKLIHVVGPRWGEGSERGKLLSATLSCLRLAEAAKLKSLALPAISTGALGYPLENCAKTMLTQIIDYTFEDLKHLRSVVLYLDNDLALDAFKKEFRQQLDELQQAGDGKVQV